MRIETLGHRQVGGEGEEDRMQLEPMKKYRTKSGKGVGLVVEDLTGDVPPLCKCPHHYPVRVYWLQYPIPDAEEVELVGEFARDGRHSSEIDVLALVEEVT